MWITAHVQLFVIPLLLSLIPWGKCQVHLRSAVITQTALPTVTVRGFLNFRTTVDGTVIVFTPASAIPSESAKSAAVLSTIQSTQSPQTIISTKSSIFHDISPTHVPQKAIQPTRASQQSYPTGLVTVLGGTVVRNGETTVHETKVIGTYIDGKYAQILQSTARVEVPIQQTPHIRPTPTTKVNGPSIFVETPLKKAYVREEVTAKPKEPEFDENNGIQSYRKPEPRRLHPRLALNPLRSRWTQSNLQKTDPKSDGASNTNKITKARLGTRRFTLPPRSSPKVRMNRFKAKLPATALEERQTYNTKVQTQKDKDKLEAEEAKTAEEDIQSLAEANSDEVVTADETTAPVDADSEQIDPSKVAKEVQTITSEVTQHLNGNQIQVQTLTHTTTIERPLHPSEFAETDLIVPTVPVEANDLDATSVHATPPLVVSRTYSVTERSTRTTVIPVFDGTSTASHTVTERFLIRKLITVYKTLPAGDMFLLETAANGLNDTDFGDDLSAAEQFAPSLYQGAIEITDEPSNELVSATPVVQSISAPTLDPSQNNMGFMANNQLPQFDMNNPLFLAAALQNPQLAAVYFGLQQFKQQQQAPQYNTITKPSTYVATDTVYNTKVVSFYDGRSTRSRTIVEPVGTTERTMTTYTTELVPAMNGGNMAMQQAQFNNVFATAKLPYPQQFNTITKTLTTLTDTTSTRTKVYTLVYNALSTRFRTVTSTSVIPTVITTVITSTVPIQMANTAQPFNIFG